MKEFVEEILRVEGVEGAAVVDKKGLFIYKRGDGENIFTIIIPGLNSLKKNMENFNVTMNEMVVTTGDKKRAFFKAAKDVFFCVLYDPEKGGYDGKIRHKVDSVLRKMEV